jgi:hypothetical protein
MSPVTHFFIGWLIANAVKIEQRDRAFVTIAGVVPDIDGLTFIADLVSRNGDWYGEYHHVLAHNIMLAFLVTLCGFMYAKRRLVTALLIFVSFHLHLLGDIAGSRGSDGYQWPIAYLWPFSNSLQLTWEGQWLLNAWQNIAITAIVFCLLLFLAWKRGYSPLEMISAKADRTFVEILRSIFVVK